MTRKDFHHPYEPYDIQQQLMESIYDCIEQGKVGIFESPTGTGKSLSLICGSLTWLRERKRKLFDEALATVEVDDDEPAWMAEHAKEVKSREIREMRAEMERRLAVARERERKLKERAEKAANGEPVFKRQKKSTGKLEEDADEDQYVLDDYASDEDGTREKTQQYSAETTKLMEKLGLLHQATNDSAEENSSNELKIFFCSRTHSQLSQFIGELQRVKLPPGMPPDDDDKPGGEVVEELKHLTLGSRKNLCINPKVNKLASQTAVNERCVELQQSKTPPDQKCTYLPSKESADTVLDFRDRALATIRDIEDMAKLGSRLQICPYYASRPAIGHAEIVTLPYPLLLQKSAREALGISLKDHVVVIDEAHNLMNAVEGIYSAQVSGAQLQRAREGLIVYLQKFRNKLKGSNRTYVTQLVRMIDSLLNVINDVQAKGGEGSQLTQTALLSGKGVDQINLVKLVRYMNESKLARKVEGYIQHLRQQDTSGHKPKTIANEVDQPVEVPTLMHIQSFLLCLMNPSKEGSFLWSKVDGQIIIQYLLLDPSEHFRDVVEDARAVIMAGGTMSPMDDYRQQLFPYLDSIVTFSCGHLIPPSSLFVRAVTADDSGRMDFSFKSRNDNSSARLGSALERIATRVHAGMVVFFPSYTYLDTLVRSWRTTGLLVRLEAAKPTFFDSRSISAEETFRSYSEAITANTKRGALLFSVIGGKLSEGINFSDNLGRCVVVVGLPFPNLETPEWKAKMRYLEAKAASRGEPKGKAGREHAENLCMRSVNQAIGRAIRHKNDWASILLFDARYADERIQGKLPGWIKNSSNARESGAVKDVVRDLEGFFERKCGLD